MKVASSSRSSNYDFACSSFLTRQSRKHLIEGFLSFAVPISIVGLISWVLWNFALFRNAIYFAIGPFSAQVQAAASPYSVHLHIHPLYSISIILNVASCVWNTSPSICVLGLATFLYMNRRESLLFSLLTIVMLMVPLLADYAAMIEGSGEIYPVGVNQWFNGRYLIFAAPLIAFGSTSLAFYATKTAKRNMLPTVVIYSLLFFHIFSYFLIRDLTREKPLQWHTT